MPILEIYFRKSLKYVQECLREILSDFKKEAMSKKSFVDTLTSTKLAALGVVHAHCYGPEKKALGRKVRTLETELKIAKTRLKDISAALKSVCDEGQNYQEAIHELIQNHYVAMDFIWEAGLKLENGLRDHKIYPETYHIVDRVLERTWHILYDGLIPAEPGDDL